MESNDNLSLEKLIKEVDYVKLGTDYVPTKFAIKFINFIKLVNGEAGEENKSPLFHYKMLDAIHSYKNTLIVAFRGSSKTTVMGEYLILYLATFGNLDGFGEISVGMYISDTMDNGVKNMRNNLEFRYQNSEFLQKFIPKVKFTDPEWEFENADGHLLTIKGYGASPLTLDTKLYTETGFTTIKDCKIGDKIYDADGKLATIVTKSIYHYVPVYKITLDDGRSIKVSENHINSVVRKYTSSIKGYEYRDEEYLTSELITIPLKLKGKQENRLYIRNPKPIEYPEKELPLDPYTLGLLLGDGQLKKDGSNNLIIKDIYKQIEQLGLRGCYTYHKFIPTIYKFGSVHQRLELLRGLMDTDGTIDTRVKTSKPSFSSISKQLANDVVDLVRSLGGKATLTSYQPKSKNRALVYKVLIQINQSIFKLPRKKIKERIGWRNNDLNAIVKIERIEDQPTQCIGLDNDSHLFIASNYVVTHNTGVRGFKKYGIRPQIAILDDLMSDKSAESKTITKDIENIIYKAVRQAMHPTKRKVIWIGTPFNKKDPLYQAACTSSWHTEVFPICEKFPCTKKEFVGAWEDRFPYDAVKAEYNMLKENGKIDAFNQELMLRILSDDDRLVLDEDIVWYRKSKILDHLHEYNIYMTTDFATSETEKSDYSVISVWALDYKGVFHWIDGIVKRQDMSENVNDVFRFISIYKPLATGIEISGQQKGFVSWLKREMVIRGIYFYIASDKNSGEEGLRPNTSKLTRFNIALPLFKQRKIAFPEELKESKAMLEFIDELTSVTPSGFKSAHDDCADTISQLPLIDYFRPMNPNDVKKNEETVFDTTSKYFTNVEKYDNSQSSYIV